MIDVVAAYITEGDRFLICQRSEHKSRPLLWEFVGGKVEPGETKAEALVREVREELGMTIKVTSEILSVDHVYPDITIRLTLLSAVIVEGEPHLLEHHDSHWITWDEVDNYTFCPADTEMLPLIKEKLGVGLVVADCN